MATAGSTIFQAPMQKSVYDIDQNDIVDLAEASTAIVGMTAAEVNQLKNIDTTTISTIQWGYLGALNQALTQASNVTFNQVTLGAGDLLNLSNCGLSGQAIHIHTFGDGDVNVGGDIITIVGHGFINGDIVWLTTTGTLPAGLSTGRDYYIISSAVDTFQLSLTKGGGAVNITGAAGGGTHTITVQVVIDVTGNISLGADESIYFGDNNEGRMWYESALSSLYIDNSCFWIRDSDQWNVYMGIDLALGYCQIFPKLSVISAGIVAPLAQVHIGQLNNSAAIPTLHLEQADVSEGVINFVADDRGAIAGVTNSVSSVRVELGGTVGRLAIYANA